MKISQSCKYLIIRGMATKVPTELPMLTKATRSSIRVILLCQKPRTEVMSSLRAMKSLT